MQRKKLLERLLGIEQKDILINIMQSTLIDYPSIDYCDTENNIHNAEK